MKSGSYIANLQNVDFITWKMNQTDGSFWMKLHMGPKEVRFVCDSMLDVKRVILSWAKTYEDEFDISENELGGEENGFDF